MGCDIHTYIETKINGEWRYIKGSDDGDSFFCNRHYLFFSFLGGVRGDNSIEPIAANRGVPCDVTAHTKKQIDNWGGDMHSKSHVSLRELIMADWEQLIPTTEYVSEHEYAAYREFGILPVYGQNMPGSHLGELTYSRPIRDILGTEVKEIFRLINYVRCFIDDSRIIFGFDN